MTSIVVAGVTVNGAVAVVEEAGRASTLADIPPAVVAVVALDRCNLVVVTHFGAIRNHQWSRNIHCGKLSECCVDEGQVSVCVRSDRWLICVCAFLFVFLCVCAFGCVQFCAMLGVVGKSHRFLSLFVGSLRSDQRLPRSSVGSSSFTMPKAAREQEE